MQSFDRYQMLNNPVKFGYFSLFRVLRSALMSLFLLTRPDVGQSSRTRVKNISYLMEKKWIPPSDASHPMSREFGLVARDSLPPVPRWCCRGVSLSMPLPSQRDALMAAVYPPDAPMAAVCPPDALGPGVYLQVSILLQNTMP